MGKDEFVTLKEWIDILKDFYEISTIRKLFTKNNGNGNALYEILHSKTSKSLQKEAYILKYLEQKPSQLNQLKQTARDVFAVGANKVQVSIRKKCDKAERELLQNKERYISKSSGDDFIVLVYIVRRYIERVGRENMMRNIISGDSLSIREKKAKKILKDAEQLLYIIGVDCRMPINEINFVEFNIIKSEAIQDIENLKNTSLTANFTPGKLLEELHGLSEN